MPIVIITGNSITIDYKSWGVILRMTPTVLSPNRIAIHVAPEVSELTSEGQVILSEGSVIPAVRVRRAETTVELASGQSFAFGRHASQRILADRERCAGTAQSSLRRPSF